MDEKTTQKIKWAADMAKNAAFVTTAGAILLVGLPIVAVAETSKKLAMVACALGGVLVNTWKEKDKPLEDLDK